MEKHVEHEGIVALISGNMLIVRIVSSAACSGCVARSHCSPAGSNEMDIRINDFSGEYAVGEQVKVVMRQSVGMRALLAGYIVPLVVVLLVLVMAYLLTNSELVSGLSALFVLVPYYLLIKLFNRKITRTFGFLIKKIDV